MSEAMGNTSLNFNEASPPIVDSEGAQTETDCSEDGNNSHASTGPPNGPHGAPPGGPGKGYKLFLGGLPLSATSEVITAFFSPFGKVRIDSAYPDSTSLSSLSQSPSR